MCRNIHALHNFEPPATAELLDQLVTNPPLKDRQIEAARARERSANRYASLSGSSSAV